MCPQTIDGVVYYTADELDEQRKAAVTEAEAVKAKAAEEDEAKKAADAVKAQKDGELDARLKAADDARVKAETALADVQKKLDELAANSGAIGRVRELESRMATLLTEIEQAATESRALVSEEEMKRRINEAAASARRDAEKKAKDLEALLASKDETTGKELKELKDRIALAEEKEAAAAKVARHAEALVILKDAGLNAGGVGLAKKLLPDILTDDTDLSTAEGKKALVEKAQAEAPVLFGGESNKDGKKAAGVAGGKPVEGTGHNPMDQAIRQAAGGR